MSYYSTPYRRGLKEEVLKSNEFLEYVNAGINYYSSMLSRIISLNRAAKPDPRDSIVKINSSYYLMKKIGGKNFDVNIKRKVMQNKYNTLLKKYPQYYTYTPEELKKYIIESYSTPQLKTTILSYDILRQEVKAVFSKGNLDDPDPDSYQLYYGDYLNAFADAMSYSFCTGVEIAGFVFADGTAMMYFYSGATHWATRYIPESLSSAIYQVNGLSYYQGMQITSTFHTHFYSDQPGGDDTIIQALYFPNCNVIILRDFWWTVWVFINSNYTGQTY